MRASQCSAPLRIDLSDPAWCSEMHDGSGPGPVASGVLRQRHPIAAVARSEGLLPVLRVICGQTGDCSLWPFNATASTPRQQCGLRHQSAGQQPEWACGDIAE